MSFSHRIICQTERLILRELTVEDAVFAFELNNDPEVLLYTGDEAFVTEEAAAEFLAGYSHYRKYGFGRWAVVRKTDGIILGWCGLKFDEEKNEHDLGFRFFKKYWNQGYASEAARVCTELAFTRFGIKNLYGNVDSRNLASQRVLQKSGMQLLPECGRHLNEQKYLITKRSYERWLDENFSSK